MCRLIRYRECFVRPRRLYGLVRDEEKKNTFPPSKPRRSAPSTSSSSNLRGDRATCLTILSIRSSVKWLHTFTFWGLWALLSHWLGFRLEKSFAVHTWLLFDQDRYKSLIQRFWELLRRVWKLMLQMVGNWDSTSPGVILGLGKKQYMLTWT